jgi:hypothetical protein
MQAQGPAIELVTGYELNNAMSVFVTTGCCRQDLQA